MLIDEMAEPAVTLAEAQAYARVETGEEEALLAGLVRSATALCEAFTGVRLIERRFAETMAAGGDWQRLDVAPVRIIDAVELVAADGSVTVMTSDAYAADIDARGDGWVRLTDPAATGGRIRVRGVAGIAPDANGVPEPLRQGVLRLTAHLYTNRDGEDGEVPAAVTALWRPYRRMRLK